MMAPELIAPLPEDVRKRLSENDHPGLALDKYVESWSAKEGETVKWSEDGQKPTV